MHSYGCVHSFINSIRTKEKYVFVLFFLFFIKRDCLDLTVQRFLMLVSN